MLIHYALAGDESHVQQPSRSTDVSGHADIASVQRAKFAVSEGSFTGERDSMELGSATASSKHRV